MSEEININELEKVYLRPGQIVHLHTVSRIGPSGTCVDIQTDWSETCRYSGNNPEHAGYGEGVATLVNRQGDIDWTYDVFLEEQTGRFYYFKDTGY